MFIPKKDSTRESFFGVFLCEKIYLKKTYTVYVRILRSGYFVKNKISPFFHITCANSKSRFFVKNGKHDYQKRKEGRNLFLQKKWKNRHWKSFMRSLKNL